MWEVKIKIRKQDKCDRCKIKLKESEGSYYNTYRLCKGCRELALKFKIFEETGKHLLEDFLKKRKLFLEDTTYSIEYNPKTKRERCKFKSNNPRGAKKSMWKKIDALRILEKELSNLKQTRKDLILDSKEKYVVHLNKSIVELEKAISLLNKCNYKVYT